MPQPIPSAWHALPAAAGLTAFLLAAHLAGPLTPEGERLLTVSCLAVVTAWAWRWLPGRPLARAVALVAPLLPALLAAVPGGGAAAPVLGVVIALAVVARLAAGTPAQRLLESVTAAVAVAGLCLVAVRHLSWAWWLFEAGAAAVSALASALVPGSLRVGPTFAGLWPLVLASAFAVALSRPRVAFRELAPFLAGAIALLVLWSAAMRGVEAASGAALAALLATPAPHPSFTAAPGQLASLGGPLLVLLLAALALRLSGRPDTPPEGDSTGTGRPRGAGSWVAGSVAGIAGIVAAFAAALALAWPVPPPALPGGAVVAVHDAERLDLSAPAPGRYGLIRTGMFGAVGDYLEAAGYRRLPLSGRITRERLRPVAVLTLINPQRRYAVAEREAIWEHVRRGGGLLVMGDHTDLLGMRRPLNELLAPVGIRFEFDSAFPLRRHWRHSLETRPHPMTAGLVGQEGAQIGTGASLTLHGLRARAMILGRYGFGDLGNRANAGQGAYLGDYRHQRGERLGDPVLVAAARQGAGRVAVFGDTTSLQPLSLPQAFEFVERTFRYLAGGAPPRAVPTAALAWAALLAGAALTWAARPPSSALVSLALALVGADAAGDALAARAAPALPRQRLAVIDVAHVERLPLEHFVEGAMGGVGPALMRAGYLPLVAREPAPERLAGASAAVFVAPVRPAAPALLAGLSRMLARGGTLLVVAGGESRPAADRLLALCGLRLGRYPLGPAEGPAGVQFVDAWPLVPTGTTPWRSLVALGEDALIAESRPQRGRCLAIGDGRFFTDTNFEGEYDFHRPNVMLIDALLAAPRGGRGDGR
jgi:hypothetical protein